MTKAVSGGPVTVSSQPMAASSSFVTQAPAASGSQTVSSGFAAASDSTYINSGQNRGQTTRLIDLDNGAKAQIINGEMHVTIDLGSSADQEMAIQYRRNGNTTASTSMNLKNLKSADFPGTMRMVKNGEKLTIKADGGVNTLELTIGGRKIIIDRDDLMRSPAESRSSSPAAPVAPAPTAATAPAVASPSMSVRQATPLAAIPATIPAPTVTPTPTPSASIAPERLTLAVAAIQHEIFGMTNNRTLMDILSGLKPTELREVQAFWNQNIVDAAQISDSNVGLIVLLERKLRPADFNRIQAVLGTNLSVDNVQPHTDDRIVAGFKAIEREVGSHFLQSLLPTNNQTLTNLLNLYKDSLGEIAQMWNASKEDDKAWNNMLESELGLEAVKAFGLAPTE